MPIIDKEHWFYKEEAPLLAYQVGALRVLIENLGKKEIADKDGPLFDIVAGTSMGAMNAAGFSRQCDK